MYHLAFAFGYVPHDEVAQCLIWLNAACREITGLKIVFLSIRYGADIVGRAEVLTGTCTSGTKASNTAYAYRMGGVDGLSSNLEIVGILTASKSCKAPFCSSVVGRH